MDGDDDEFPLKTIVQIALNRIESHRKDQEIRNFRD